MPVLKNTTEFVHILSEWNKQDEICIAGDYDVDGVMATTIMCHSLRQLGYSVHFIIPNRLEDGYGMQKEALEEDILNNKTKLIITVDNGIGCKEMVDMAVENNCQVIITDHHLPNEDKIPETLIIDPKYNGDYFSDICGAYVALKLCQALYAAEAPTMMSIVENLIPLAGIATIADMMPMLKENRQLVKLTLSYIDYIKNDPKNPLYKILVSLNGQNFIRNPSAIATEELISYSVGPAINAISRVNGDVEPLISKLLEGLENPWAYIPSYISVNYTRQKMSNELFSDYIDDTTKTRSTIFVYDQNEYQYNIKGILGLIANKASNKYNKVILIGTRKNSDIIEFSGRSTPNYNLHDGIGRIKTKHPELSISGGGHAQAMGIRLKENSINDLDVFRDALEEDIKNNSFNYEPTIFEYEPEMETEIVSTMQALQPYGAGFAKLKFHYSGLFVNYDYDKKVALVNEHPFKMYIGQNEIDNLIGSDVDIIFTIAFSDRNEPIFNVIKE